MYFEFTKVQEFPRFQDAGVIWLFFCAVCIVRMQHFYCWSTYELMCQFRISCNRTCAVTGTGLILRNILDCTGGDIYGERGARAYNGGQGQGVRRRSPPEADSILAFER